MPSRSRVSYMGFDPMDGCCPQKTRTEARVESREGTQPRGFCEKLTIRTREAQPNSGTHCHSERSRSSAALSEFRYDFGFYLRLKSIKGTEGNNEKWFRPLSTRIGPGGTDPKGE